MATVDAGIFTRSAAPLRRREDLQFRRLTFGGEPAWGVKDPVALRYFQLHDEEYALLQLLDGSRTLVEVRDKFERLHPGRRMSLAELHAVVRVLHQEGLLLATTPEEGVRQWDRCLAARRRNRWGQWGNLLAIRFRGINPAALLNWLLPRLGWVYSPLALLLGACLILSALLLIIVKFPEVSARLPGWQDVLRAENLAWLVGSLSVVKVLHELGHALTCRYFGQECHEFGVLLFLGMPTLYCNVSDAWMLPSKRARLAITAAGVLVELVIAALCTWLWWFSVPSLFHALCFNLMLVCSVQTLLFNGNPLLRYDGYFFLSDLLEIPNLADRGMAAVRRGMLWWFCGISSRDEPRRTESRWLAAYSSAAAAYRLILSVSLVWLAYRVLEPYRLEMLAVALGGTVCGGWLWAVFASTRGLIREAARNPEEFSPGRTARRIGATLLAVGVFVVIPLPRRVTAPLVLEPAAAERVFVTVAGRLVSSVREGSQVQAGEVIAELSQWEMQQELLQLRGERDRQQLHVQNLRHGRSNDPRAETQMATARAVLTDLNSRLARRTAEFDELKLRAPRSGRVFAPPRVNSRRAESGIPTWQGTPLDEANRGSALETGTLVALIGDPDRLEAILLVSQDDVSAVQPGQAVWMWLPDEGGAIVHGTVLSVATERLRTDTRSESDPQKTSPALETQHGARRPARDSSPEITTGPEINYRVRVFVAGRPPLPMGSRGWGKIEVVPQSVWERTRQFVEKTFRIQ